MSRKIRFACLFLLLGLLFTTAQSGFAQSDPPLTFANNFFVTGDYVVGGAQGLNTNFANDGTTTGTITIPDLNPGIQPGPSANCIINGKLKQNCVPAGADIVAAFLYWQTVEKLGQPGSGKNGFFRGYAITGAAVNSNNTVSFSFGGCTGGSTGKIIETYRADVRGYLPQDASGNILANSTYQVRLPSVGPSAPLTLGATLVIIYRVLAPNFPLNSIVIYEGGFANSSAPSLTMTQKVQGFYDAAVNPVSRLTHIVGGGKNNKFQNVYLNDFNTPLPVLYASGQPFPGYYSSGGYGWDNTTWTFPDQHGHNPVNAGDASATTKVVPASSNQGCVSWGAVIVSTTVQNTDGDGILDVWKVPAVPHSLTPGYCDASVNEGQCNGPGDPAWVDLPGAVHGQKDVFLQLDYMCSSPGGVDKCITGNGTDYSFDPRLTGADVMMTNAFSAKGIHLHINPVNPSGTTQPVHAIQEQTCTDNSNDPICASVATNGLTPFPGQPGVVGWKAGFEFLKNQPLNPTLDGTTWTETQCDNNPSTCIRRFQYGRKDSYHYAVFSHAIGRPTWGLQGGSLASVMAFTNGDITFTTAAPHGLVVDPNLGNGRVTIADAITNPSLNGTHLVTRVSPPAGVLNITGTSMSALGVATYQFTQVSGHAPASNTLVTVQNTTNGNGVFNVGNATIVTVDPVHSTFTVNFNVKGFTPSAIGLQSETGGCAVPTGACAHTNSPPFYFTISITPSTVSTQTSYTELTDPNLTVTPGQASTGSGFSDIGGADTLVTLGLWGNPAFNGSSPATSPISDGQKETVQAGTFMHELGHTLGLTHGGLFFDNLAPNHPDYTPTLDANCKSNYQSVMNYMFQSDLLGKNSDVLDFSSQQLDTLNENGLLPIALGGSTSAVKIQYTTWYDLTPNLVGSKAKHHCDGSPMFFNATVAPFSADVTPIMYPHLNQALPTPWPAASLDINFDGMIDTGFRGYNDWANIDLRQIGATGSDISGPGHLGGGPGHLGGGPGHLGGGPGHLGGGPGHLGGGPGVEIDFETANAVTRPPRNLTAMEDPSPRYIHLFWFPPVFGQIGSYNIYRQPPWVPGNPPTFSVPVGDPRLIFHSTLGDPHFGEYEFVDKTASCNPAGYQYFVSAVLANTTQESEPSNIVSTGQNGETLTACYGPTGFNFSVPANAVHGSIPAVTWTVRDLTNTSGSAVNTTDNPALVTFVANGPLPGNCGTVGDTTILANGMLTPQSGASMFPASSGGNYTLNLDTDVLCAGQYTLKLILDNQLALSSHQMATAPLQLAIDVNDQDTPRITPLALPPGTVGLAYGPATLTEDGGTPSFRWSITGLPSGISQQPAGSPTILGTTCAAAGSYPVNATVTDSAAKPNSGMQAFTLQISKASTMTSVMSDVNPSVFQQMVTFTVKVAPQYSCTPTGTVTLSDGGVPLLNASNLPLNASGMATFMTSSLSVGMHSITASYGGDNSFKSSSSGVWSQTVNPAQTQIVVNPVSPPTAFVGQPITISYTFSVVAPGGSSPIAPSGNISVTANDGSLCVPQPATSGMCTLSPAPKTAGNVTFTINYPGDGNFVLSGANSNYNVYQLVFTTQPSNTGVGLTITPAVQVAAQDNTNTTLASFTGSITLAIGAGPGTLSGTTTQSATGGIATFSDLSINKIANGYTLTASPAGGVPAATSNAFNVDTFYVDGNGNFGTLDLPTGTVTQIGAGTVPGSTGMDLTPGLQVYAYNASNQLMQITPSTGAATLVGTGTIPDQATTGALTDGSYFGIDAVTGNLFSINLATGATTSVGSTSAAVLPTGCTVETSLAGSANVLYYTIGYSGVSCSSPMPDTLYQINPTSGATTTIGQVTVSGSGVNTFVGSAFVGGTLYGFTAGGQEYTINPATGVATLLTGTTATAPILAAASSQ